MKKILLASGCSFTDNNFRSIFHPEMDTSWSKWPELLAEKLDMECINLGRSGAGNEYIYNSIVDKFLQLDKSRIGLVIAGWSKYERRDWEEYYTGGDLKWTNGPIDDIGNTHYFIKKSLRYYYNFQIFCEYHNIPYKHCQMLAPFTSIENAKVVKSQYWQKIKKVAIYSKNDLIKTFFGSDYIENINEKNFIGWPIISEMDGYNMEDYIIENKYIISENDKHPNAKGQEKIADFIYENL